MTVVAEFSVVPVREGSLRPYVKIALDEIKKAGLKYDPGAMGSTIEGELDEVLEAVKNAHRAVRAAGADRVITSIRFDERSGFETIEERVKGLE